MIKVQRGSKLKQLGDGNVEINRLTCLGNLCRPDMGKAGIRNKSPRGLLCARVVQLDLASSVKGNNKHLCITPHPTPTVRSGPHMVDKCSTTEPYLQPLLVVFVVFVCLFVLFLGSISLKFKYLIKRVFLLEWVSLQIIFYM